MVKRAKQREWTIFEPNQFRGWTWDPALFSAKNRLKVPWLDEERVSVGRLSRWGHLAGAQNYDEEEKEAANEKES